MSFWGREASALPMPLQDHTPLSLFHLLSRTMCPRTPLSVSPKAPSLPASCSEGNREPWTLDFGKYTVFHRVWEVGRKIWYFLLAVGKDLIYKTAFETAPHPVYFLCQPGLSLKWGCPWPAQWSTGSLNWNLRVPSGRAWWAGELDFLLRKMTFISVFKLGAGERVM